MCGKVIDRTAGSILVAVESVPLIESQREDIVADAASELERECSFKVGSTEGKVAMLGSKVCGDNFTGDNGREVLDVGLICGSDSKALGVLELVLAVSSFLSDSRARLLASPSPLDLAGLRRATCSIHSTLAFWHLRKSV